MIILIVILVILILYTLVIIGMIEEEIEKSDKWNDILKGDGRDD